MSKHTMAPWRVHGAYPCLVVSPSYEIAATSPYGARRDNLGLPDDDERAANARLIAAAPDLLLTVQLAKGIIEAVRPLIAHLDPEAGPNADSILKSINAVLAKAGAE